MAKSGKDGIQRLDIPKIQMPIGSRDVMRGPHRPTPGNDEHTGEAAPRRRRKKSFLDTRLAVWLGAWAFAVLWTGAVGVYSYFYYGERLLNQPPAALTAIVIGILVPAGLSLMLALMITRSMRLNDAAMRLAGLSRDLIDPSTTAANDVAKLGAVIRKELEGLNREIDGAVTRIGTLEGRLQQQTSMIGETSSRLDKQTAEITTRLSEERERVDTATRSLSAEARLINETLDAQGHAINTSAKQATEILKAAETALEEQTDATSKAISGSTDAARARLAQAQESLKEQSAQLGDAVAVAAEAAREKLAASEAILKDQTNAVGRAVIEATEVARGQLSQSAIDLEVRTQALGTAVTEAAEMARGISAEIAQETDKLGSVSSEAQSRAEAVVARFDEQHTAVVALVEQLSEQQVTLDVGLDQQRKVLSDMAQSVSRQIKNIEESVEGSAGGFQQAVDAARQTAEQAGAGFGEQANALSDAAEASAARLQDASESIRALSIQARDDIDQQIRASNAVLEQQSVKARALLSEQAKDAAAAFEAALEELRGRLSEIGEVGTEAMTARAGELEKALHKGEARMRDLSDRLDASIRGVTEGTDDVGKLLGDTADAFEARMAQFPAHAEDAVKQVRAQINSQIESLAKLADQAADRAQTLAKAVEQQKIEPPVAAAPPERRETPSTLGAREDPRITSSTPATSGTAQPELPGRDVYPQVWDGMDDSWGSKKGRGNTRPRLGQFDDVAKSLVSRLRPGNSKSERPKAALRAQLSGVKESHKHEPEDISDFRVIRATPDKADKPASTPPTSTPIPERKSAPRLETKGAAYVAPKAGPAAYKERGWKEILQNVDRRADGGSDDAPKGVGDEASFQRNALLIIEKLQAMSIDIDRALEDTPPTELLDRYMNGERNVFARRLATFTGPEMLEKISRKFQDDSEFRADVNRYIQAFEELLKAARGRDRENILIETYLTSQTGKVYMIFGTATGHLNK